MISPNDLNIIYKEAKKEEKNKQLTIDKEHAEKIEKYVLEYMDLISEKLIKAAYDCQHEIQIEFSKPKELIYEIVYIIIRRLNKYNFEVLVAEDSYEKPLGGGCYTMKKTYTLIIRWDIDHL